jgi:signal transduction histidine kinase
MHPLQMLSRRQAVALLRSLSLGSGSASRRRGDAAGPARTVRPMASLPPSHPAGGAAWQRFAAGAVQAFHAYAGWLVSISWLRFFVLAVLLLASMGILLDMPPFTWRITEQTTVDEPRRVTVVPPVPPAPRASVPAPPKAPIVIDKPAPGSRSEGVDISIGKEGIRITPKPARPAEAASAAASAAERAGEAAASAASLADKRVVIQLPDGPTSEAVREAVADARQQIEESIREAREEAEQAARDAAEARRDAEAAIADLKEELGQKRSHTRVTKVGIGDFLMQFSVFWVMASALLKIVYKGRMQAEVKAAQATETAESESLKRQVVEARMAAMQAQVEPHFLFNTLASIDHLIETDPPRASLMQKNLIALLRASMPSMREVNSPGSASTRDLGRELAVIRPYLEILKVRMEERLATEIRVSDGLLSADFPPMMLQSLVENAIKHGLEPKAEGGRLSVSAEIVHGKLAVTVADTGLGFGKAATAGTGIGLSNIRERLQLLYGSRAGLKVAENPGGGTMVTITVPYQSHSEDSPSAA